MPTPTPPPPPPLATSTPTFGPPTLVTRTFGADPAAGGWESQNLYARQMADVNGDGRADIVGFGYGGTYVSLANADGTFGGARLAVANFGVGREAGGWENGDRYPRMLADVNGDGRADIVGFGHSATYVALSTADGGFSAATVAIANFGAGREGGGWESQNLYGRALADVNGDGRADIVAFGHSATYVALGTAAGGFSTPTAAIANFGVGREAGGWASGDRHPRMLADVNGDGFDDIVGFGEAGAYVALGNRSGGFGAAQLASNAFGAGAGAGGWESGDRHPRMLGDVNGDGRADIVGFGESGVSLALGAVLLPIA